MHENNEQFFHQFPSFAAFGLGPGVSSLQFINNEDLYFASSVSGQAIHHFKFEEAYCINPNVLEPIYPW